MLGKTERPRNSFISSPLMSALTSNQRFSDRKDEATHLLVCVIHIMLTGNARVCVSLTGVA